MEPAPTTGNERSLDSVLAQIDAYVPSTGVDPVRFESLKAELKRLLIARATDDLPSGAGRRARQTSGSKSPSIAPSGTMNAVTDLAAIVNPAGTQATLTWTEVLPGDYDNNGVVDIGDLIPLALYYGQRTDSGPDDAHRLVNGDADPEINIWDLGAIAGNYGAHIQGYQAWRGHWNGTSTDWETASLPNIANPFHSAFSVDRPSPPPVSTRPAYTYTDDISGLTDKNNIRYKVTAFGDGAPGAESNEAAVPATIFSVSGKVTLLGNGLAGVTLTLAPGNLHATTQADGSYSISGVANGTYTLTPTGTGYVFTPASIPATVNGANITGLDFAATGGLANSAWPRFHGNAQNTGQSQYIGAQTNHVKWTYSHYPYSTMRSSPAIGADGTVYVGSDNHSVYAINPADGSVKWSYATDSWVWSSPAISADGTVYIGGSDGKVYALSPADGSAKWTYTTGGSVESSPAIGADGTVYVGSDDDKMYALNPADGSVKWSYATSSAVISSPAIGADGTVYVGAYVRICAINPLDGTVKWTRQTGAPVTSSPAVGADGTVYVGSEDSSVYALNASDGSVKWSYVTGGYVDSSPAIGADGTVYVGSSDLNLYALSPLNGSAIWIFQTLGPVASSPTIGADGTIYFGSYDGKVYALNPADGSVKWRYNVGYGAHSSPAIGSDGTVYIGGGDWYLYAFGGVGPSTYSISGTVTLSTGVGLAGVTMMLTPGGKTATTDPNGYYKISDVPEGTYTLTPTATGYVFTPAQRSVTVRALDVTGKDFIAPTYSVSGAVTQSGSGVPGVTMILTPGWRRVVTQLDGAYVITGVPDGKYTLTPVNAGCTFAPLALTVVVADADVTGQDFNAVASGVVSSAWPKFRGNAQCTGQSLRTGAQTNSLRWTYATGDVVYSSPAVGAEGTVYIGSNDEKVYALNPSDGSIKWTHATGAQVTSSPAIGADWTVYMGSGDGKVYALNPSDGSVKWTHATGGPVQSSPAIGTDGTVYIGSWDNNVYALNPADGSVKWTHATVNGVGSSPAIGGDGTVYVAGSDDYVYALNPADGSLKWTSPIGSYVGGSPAVGADGTVYIGCDDHNVYALNPVDGSAKWVHTTGDPVHGSPAIGADGSVYVGNYAGNVYALDPANGGVKWVNTTGFSAENSPAIGADGIVYFGMYALNGSDGSVKWSYGTGSGAASSPAIAGDGTVYVGGYDHNVYAFGP